MVELVIVIMTGNSRVLTHDLLHLTHIPGVGDIPC